MDNKVDFFQKKMSNPRSYARQKNKSRIWLRILFIILILCIGCLIFFRSALHSSESENAPFEFSLGEEVYLQGNLIADGDIITYTHTIDDVNYGKIGIKSDVINLSDFAGFVELTGVVEKFYQGNPIVKVLSLSGGKAGIGDGVVIDGNAGYYFKGAGIYLLPKFFDEYVLLNEGENGEIHIQNIETEKEIVLKYFRCNSSDPSRNCKGLNESFENNHAQSFKTSEGDTYYKQSENQWFVANGNWRGVFINDVTDDAVFELKDLIKFANEKNINEWVKSRATSICQGSGEKLQKINNSEINLKQEGLIVTVSGDGIEKQITCQILVDFSAPTKGELQSLTIGDVVVPSNETGANEELKETTGNIIEAPISATSLDTNVPQLQLKKECIENPGKEGCVKYESYRGGYTLHFPSSNISFSVSPIRENFGRNDVDCSYVINVIKYSDKDNLEISPAVRIYECKGSVEKSWAQGIVVYPRLDKKFIVQMNDGAWNDFSTNLKFEELVEE